MKRLAILSMASFYLLLTTGMFVCILSCSSTWFFTNMINQGNELAIHNTAVKQKSKDHCKGKEDCSCCKKHGNYTVKENIKPSFEYFSSLNIPILIANHFFTPFLVVPKNLISSRWHQSNAPPPGSIGPDIHIRICSFLI